MTLLHARLFLLFMGVCPFQVCWWSLAIKWDYFQYFPDRYLLSITMVFGATVAGKTEDLYI